MLQLLVDLCPTMRMIDKATNIDFSISSHKMAQCSNLFMVDYVLYLSILE